MTDTTDKKKRAAPISYRPPADLTEEFRARVEASGLSVNAYITQAVFNLKPSRQSRRPSVDAQALAQVLAQGAAIADGFKYLERLAEEGHDIREPVEAAARSLAEMRSALFMALGRTP